MATLEVKVRILDDVKPHPNADRLELAVVGGYHAVIAKGAFQKGDKIIYIPVDAVLPQALIESLGLVGKLSGPSMNRVSTVKLRGMISQGIILNAHENHEVGQNVADELGIVKYAPEIPDELKGAVYPLEYEECFRFDIENIKDYPAIIEEGEQVVFTEKLHGVCMIVGSIPPSAVIEGPKRPEHYNGRSFVSSKGLFGSRLAFKHDTEKSNLYLQTAHENDLFEKARFMSSKENAYVFLLGEVFGSGVQDLSYGLKDGEKKFRLFAIAIGRSNYVSEEELSRLCLTYGLPRVPVLYVGPFSKEKVEEYTNGRETFSGDGSNIREGIVITPYQERTDPTIGRVSLKSVSADYLMRKGGTEYS